MINTWKYADVRAELELSVQATHASKALDLQNEVYMQAKTIKVRGNVEESN